MRYKPAPTSNKFEILEAKPEMHNKFDQNANLSCTKQSVAATKTQTKAAQFEKVKNDNRKSGANIAKPVAESTRSRPAVRVSSNVSVVRLNDMPFRAIVQHKDRVGHVCDREGCDVCADMPALAPDWQDRITTSRVPLVYRLMSLQAKFQVRTKIPAAMTVTRGFKIYTDV